MFSSSEPTVYIILTPSVTWTVEMTFKYRKRNLTPLVKKCYELYFGCKVYDKDKSWTHNIYCETCMRLLTGWVNRSWQMPFAFPMVWKEPNNHSCDSYLCVNSLTGINSKSKHTRKCPDLPSAIRSVPHSEELPVTKTPKNLLAMTTLILTKITDRKRGARLIAIDTWSKPFLVWTPYINTRRF